jgi:hypothetical protein
LKCGCSLLKCWIFSFEVLYVLFWSAGCSLLWSDGFCSLHVLHFSTFSFLYIYFLFCIWSNLHVINIRIYVILSFFLTVLRPWIFVYNTVTLIDICHNTGFFLPTQKRKKTAQKFKYETILSY